MVLLALYNMKSLNCSGVGAGIWHGRYRVLKMALSFTSCDYWFQLIASAHPGMYRGDDPSNAVAVAHEGGLFRFPDSVYTLGQLQLVQIV